MSVLDKITGWFSKPAPPAKEPEKVPEPTKPLFGHVDQLQLTNGATRCLPLNDMLLGILTRAAYTAGVNVEVYSGGQPSTGPNRVGSHRHDNGRAADVKLYVYNNDGTKRYLKFTDSDDVVAFRAFVIYAKREGVTGVGAGVNYMGPESIHVGFGTKAIWGEDGRGVNTPKWLREAWDAA